LELHVPTLFLMVWAASIVCAMVMYINWRINQGMHGIKLWMMGAFCYTAAFLVTLVFPLLSIAPEIRIAVNNTFTLSALLCVLEGCLRFKGHLSERRWKWAFVVIPIFFMMSWINNDHAATRYLFHDALCVVGLLLASAVMVRDIGSRNEVLIYGMFALFSTILALMFANRWLSALAMTFSTPGGQMQISPMQLVGLMLYTIGWTFSVTVACYYRATQRARRLALEDSLTGLPNRRALDDELGSICRQVDRDGRGFGVIALDLDEFKTINDTLGHQRGDDLLVEVANRLRRYVRQSDFAGRLGGDEFLIILRNINSEEEAQCSFERLVAQLRDTNTTEEAVQRVEVSAGLALWPVDGTTPSALLRTADRRMYTDKLQRRPLRPAARDEQPGINPMSWVPDPAS